MYVRQRTRTYDTTAARFSQQCVRSCCNSQPTLHYPASTCFGQRFVLSCCNVFWPAFCTVLLQRVLASVLYCLVATCFGQRFVLSCYNMFWPTFVISCYNVFWSTFVLSCSTTCFGQRLYCLVTTCFSQRFYCLVITRVLCVLTSLALSCCDMFQPKFVLTCYSIFRSFYGRAALYFSKPRSVLLQRVWFKQFY